MSRNAMAMIGGIAMTAVCGALMLVWLAMNEGSGIVGLMFIIGMLVGIGVFAGGAMSDRGASGE